MTQQSKTPEQWSRELAHAVTITSNKIGGEELICWSHKKSNEIFKQVQADIRTCEVQPLQQQLEQQKEYYRLSEAENQRWHAAYETAIQERKNLLGHVEELSSQRTTLQQRIGELEAVLVRAKEMMLIMNGMAYPLPQQTRKYEVFKLIDTAITHKP